MTEMAGRGKVREHGLLRSSLDDVCNGNEFRAGTTKGETMEGRILFKCVAGAKFPNVEAEGFALDELLCRWGVDVVYSSYRIAICARKGPCSRIMGRRRPFLRLCQQPQLQLQAFTVA